MKLKARCLLLGFGWPREVVVVVVVVGYCSPFSLLSLSLSIQERKKLVVVIVCIEEKKEKKKKGRKEMLSGSNC